jgi:gamma-glutamylputrescine oxidase
MARGRRKHVWHGIVILNDCQNGGVAIETGIAIGEDRRMNRAIESPITYLSGTGWVVRPAELQPKVIGDVTCDVAVIGGGLGGMSAALRLAQLGCDVALIEADLCGWGASGRNAGYLSNSIGSDHRILNLFYSDRVRDLARFANTSVTFTEELIDLHGIDCHYERTGMLVTATTQRQLRAIRKLAKPGGRSKVLSSEEAGVPAAFLGGLRMPLGGTLNPAELSLGLRETALRAGVRIYEDSPVRKVKESGSTVELSLDQGTVRANQVLLTTNAFMNNLNVTPRWLSTPVRVSAVETHPVDGARLDEAGWTSRIPIVTTHLVMESYRTTQRGSILCTVRRMQMPRGPIGDRPPDQVVVTDILNGFRKRFPTLSDVAPARTWGGWVGMTPSTLPMAGRLSSRVSFSIACNGHGLPQAPYLGYLVAEHLAGGDMHQDLKTLWRSTPRFAPGMVNPLTLKLAWLADRITDRMDRVLR